MDRFFHAAKEGNIEFRSLNIWTKVWPTFTWVFCLGAAFVPDCKSPQFFIDMFKKDPNGLEEFLSLPVVQDKIIALEKSAADLKSAMMAEKTIE